MAEWFSIFLSCLTPGVLFYLMVGTVAGYVIGVLPGLSATMGVALLTPLTFWLPEEQGFAMLIGVFNAGVFFRGNLSNLNQHARNSGFHCNYF